MRYFILIFGIVVLVTMLIAGRRGDISRNRPIQIFPDMKRQAKLRPQTANTFFASGFSSQLPQQGTVAQGEPMMVAGKAVYPFEDVPFNTGRVTSKTNFVELNPVPMSKVLLDRGQERYGIYCSPCHGMTGMGDGVVKKFGMLTIRSLHEQIIANQGDGELFNTISYGKLTMMGYAAQIPVEDRWAIVAYVRALQMSRLGSQDDLSPEAKAKFK